ncbi:MAG: hypothetical protein JW761_15555 [Prolixibacteraceae bacterium]|nr:hypothetical protein [Prolixibacteraceae bacterium]
MNIQKKHSGFAIAIAWPETWCKQPGAWYDDLLFRIGINKNHFYQVGHAALVLVDRKTQRCYYFDFGRYHTPFQHGRVRSEATDDGLRIHTKARISANGKQIVNFKEILTELQQNPECHGEGAIHASYGRVDFAKAFAKANQLQQMSPIRYGPFTFNGSNCSRFVNAAIRAGKPSWRAAFKLNFRVPLTPTPMNNVKSFGNRTVLPKLIPVPIFSPQRVSDKRLLQDTLPEPKRPGKVPPAAQWLAGEGAGSWFSIVATNDKKFEMTRFSPEGKLECRGEFIISNQHVFRIDQTFRFEHLSHCRKVRIRQDGQSIEFERSGSFDFQKKDHLESLLSEAYVKPVKRPAAVFLLIP